jgi:hypothetical protein
MFGNLFPNRVSINGDKIVVRQGNGIARSEEFVLPFDSGLSWFGNVGEQRDSSEVIRIDSVTTPAGGVAHLSGGLLSHILAMYS